MTVGPCQSYFISDLAPCIMLKLIPYINNHITDLCLVLTYNRILDFPRGRAAAAEGSVPRRGNS
jgi:hypothetical protein